MTIIITSAHHNDDTMHTLKSIYTSDIIIPLVLQAYRVEFVLIFNSVN